MAPLTWRNVDAPDLGRAADILNSVSQNWGQGFNALSGALDKARESQVNRRSAPAFDILARVASEGDVAGALNQVEGMVRPEDRSSELMQAIAALRGDALGYEGKRASTTSVLGSHNRAQQTHDRKIAVEDQLAGKARDIVAAQEGAMYGPLVSNAPGTVSGGAPYNDREILARTLMAEAGGEGYDGMIAAGSVINNRVRSGKYGDGVRGVIMKPGQFSAWNSVTGYAGGKGGLDMAGMKVSEDAYRAADALLSGQYRDITGGATHYYNPAAADPVWGQKAGGQWTRIGNHVFGSPDGSPGAGQAPRISDLIGEDNLVDPATWMGLVTGIQNSGDEASRDRDDDLKRDFEFGTGVVDRERSDQAYDESRAATELAVEAIKATNRPEDVAPYIAKSGKNAQVISDALAKAAGLDIAAMQALPYDPTRTTPLEDLSGVEQDAAAFIAAQSSAISGNDPARIGSRVAEITSNTDPALHLENLSKTGEEPGNIQQAIRATAAALGVSDAEAEALLEESTYRSTPWHDLLALASGQFGDGVTWGDTGVNVNKAIELGRQIRAEKGIREAAEIGVGGQQRMKVVTDGLAELEVLQDDILKKQEKGLDTTREQAIYAERLKALKAATALENVAGKLVDAPAVRPSNQVDQPNKAEAAAMIEAEATAQAVKEMSAVTGVAPKDLLNLSTEDLKSLIENIDDMREASKSPTEKRYLKKVADQARELILAKKTK